MGGWYRKAVADVIRELNTDAINGLSDPEAKARLDEFGPNVLIEKRKKKLWVILFEQFTSTLVLILIVASIISGFLGKPTETIAILAIVFLFAILGFVQEYRAEKAFNALKKLTVPVVRVRRNGMLSEISARDLVRGDILNLEEGNIVPADVRIIESVNLRIQEASLTGESEPVEKDIEVLDIPDPAVGDRKNMAYLSTMVTYGHGKAVVVETGMQTELGRIAGLIQEMKVETTPLQKKLNSVGKNLAVLGIAVALLIMLIGIILGESISMMFLTAVSIAVAVVPEGLPAVVTVTLALGAQRMFKRKTLIRKLTAVETLGSVTTICSDKTGTLTENRMTVTAVDVAGRYIEITEAMHLPAPVPGGTDCSAALMSSQPLSLCLVLTGSALCNDATLIPNPNTGHYDMLGDPTEGALLMAATHIGLIKDNLLKIMPRIDERPFDSTRKRMTTVHLLPNDKSQLPKSLKSLPLSDVPYLAFTKGAVDSLLEISNLVWMDGSLEPMTEMLHQRIQTANDRIAQKGMRVLGIAMKFLDSGFNRKNSNHLETDMIFIGLISMIDPPRAEVKLAVSTCKSAGIRPVMITGDHPLTARFIAHELGITDNDHIITGHQLNRMSQQELEDQVEKVSIYARVSPEHKLRIVESLQKRGHIVAMTGDGVNDSPALKKADIGIAMGITGTDVSKEASEMVLLDDNFATIVAAVEEGRVIYDNLRRFIKFSIAGNIGKVFVMLFAPLFGIHLALLPLQLLWLNLLTDGLLGLGLGLEPAEKNTMQRPPRSPHEKFLGNGMGFHLLWVGTLIGIIALALGLIFHNPAKPQDNTWQTMIFTVLAFLQIGQAMGMRSIQKSKFNLNFHSNPTLFILVAVTIVLQLAAVYAPFLNRIFSVTPLPPYHLALCMALTVITYGAVKFEKLITMNKEQSRWIYSSN